MNIIRDISKKTMTEENVNKISWMVDVFYLEFIRWC